jgi:hypothetical protein
MNEALIKSVSLAAGRRERKLLHQVFTVPSFLGATVDGVSKYVDRSSQRPFAAREWS